MLMYAQVHVYLLPEVGALMQARHVCDNVLEKPVAVTRWHINGLKVLLYEYFFSYLFLRTI